MTPLTPTEIEELRIAIAEECGWHVELDDEQFHRVTDGNGNRNHELWCSDYAAIRAFPPFTTSLDAIQTAAMERFKSGLECAAFSQRLTFQWINETTRQSYWQLTPLDWCIAFARTAKIWRYKIWAKKPTATSNSETHPPRWPSSQTHFLKVQWVREGRWLPILQRKPPLRSVWRM